jgi:uncharacterized protein YjbI with pentapeptide repeats
MANHFNKSGDFYVSALDGDDTTGTGTAELPVQTIAKAVLLAEAAGTAYQQIIVGSGIYNERITFASTAANFSTIEADGVVIVDGTGLAATSIYQGFANPWTWIGISFVNFGAILSATSNYGCNFTNCSFKNVNELTTNQVNNTAYPSTRLIFTNCVFENLVQTNTVFYIRNVTFTDCTFINCDPTGNKGTTSSNTYAPIYRRCVFSADSGSIITTAGSGQTPFFESCIFQENLRIDISQGGFLNTDITEDFLNNNRIFFTNSIIASMSFNDNITGSGTYNQLNNTMPINATTSDLYIRGPIGALNGAGGLAPRTAYGFDNESANPLHTTGGATWDNITTSSLGGFQISSSAVPSGSITTAVIDQGSIKIVKSIDTAFTTTANNAAAPSTYPSGSNNHNPVRYQYEMRYGNTTPLSGNYSIFEWGQTPFVNSNGTGSGDQLFDTGSYTNISTRYLQLRITLRSDISGSI